MTECPCCAGEHEAPSVLDLCDECIGAWLNGQWPHDCDHKLNCTTDPCPSRSVDPS